MKTLPGRRILSVLLYCIVSTSVFGSAENDVRDDWRLLLCKSTGFHFDRLSDRSSFNLTATTACAFKNTSALSYNSSNGITSAHIALSIIFAAIFFLITSFKCYKYFVTPTSLPRSVHPSPFGGIRRGLLSFRRLKADGKGYRSFHHFTFASNPISLIRSVLPSPFGGIRRGLLSFRQLKQTAKDIALFFILQSLLNPNSLLRSVHPSPFGGIRRGLLSFRQLKQTAKDIALIITLALFFVFAGKDTSAGRLHNDRLLMLDEHSQIPAKFNGTTSLFDFAQLTSAVSAPAVAITSTATGGNWSNAATWVGGSVPVAGDDVIIANGATVTIDTHTSALGSLTVGQGRSGILQFDAIAERTVTVSGIVTINSGGTFRSAPPTTTSTVKDNLLVVGVSLINNGTLDFCVDTSGAGIKFIGTTNGNSMFNCEGSVQTNLQETNGVILEMDNPGKTLLFYPGADFKVCSTATKGFLTIVSGIFKLASGAIPFSNPVFSAGSYTIPATGGFELSNASAVVTGQNGTVTNQGKIIVSAGTYNIGTASGNSLLTSNDGTFAQSGGTINIAGRFKAGGGNCNISGGTMNIATIGYADAGEAAFHISADANLNMVGAPLITFTYPHSNTVPFNDVYIESGRYKSIAGGTFQMGTSATPELSTFYVSSEIPLDRITVFNECAIRVVNTSESQIANTVKGTFGKVVLPLTAPEGITAICNGTVPAAYPNLQAFTDAGGKAMYHCTLVPASFKFVGQTQSGTSCPYTITRTYQVTDIFGSSGTAQHLIFVETEAIAPPPEAVAEPAKEEEEEEVVKLKSAMATITSTATGGPWNDAGTWVGNVVPGANDDVVIESNATVTANDVTINASLSLKTGATLEVSGNWANNGTFTAGTGTVEFTGSASNSIGGTNTSNFNKLTINKGNDITSILTVNQNISCNDKLVLTNGLLKLDAGTVNLALTSGFTIPTTAGIKIDGGILTSGDFTIINNGLFQIVDGNVTLGQHTGNSLETKTGGTFQIDGGNFSVAGRLVNTEGIANIFGGTIILSVFGHSNGTFASFHISADTKLEIKNNPQIIFQHPNTGTKGDIFIASGGSGTKTIVGGTFIMGNSSTLATNNNFVINSPFALHNLTVNNTNSPTVQLAGNDLSINNQLTMNGGNIDATSKNLIIANAGNITRTSGYITGNLQRSIATGSNTYLFPVGTASGYTPVSLALTGVSATGNITVSSNDGAGTIPTNLNSTSRLNRHWDITSSGLGSFTATGTYTYLAGDLVGGATQPNLKIYHISPPSTITYPTFSTGVNSFTASNLTTFGEFGAAECGTITIGGNLTMVSCNGGNNGAIDITVTGGAAPLSYSWSGPGSFTSTNKDISNLIAGTYNITVTDDAECTGTGTFEITQPTVLSATSTHTNVLCFGASTGAINITASGGTGAYTYAWTGAGVNATAEDQTGLAAGNYAVIVTDANGCSTASLPVTITQPATSPTVIESHTNVLCFGASTGAINITASGGTGAYTYAWPGAGVNATAEDQTGLAAGTYSVIVTDANGCSTTSLPVTITQPAAALSVTASSNSPFCVGSTLSLNSTPTGGTPAYGYSWTGPNGFTSNLQNPSRANMTLTDAGIYTVNVTDANGCSASATETITVNPLPTVDAGPDRDICYDINTVTLAGSIGGAALSATWTSSGTGSFTPNTNTLNATYTPSAADKTSGTVTLTLTTDDPLGPCSAVADQMILTINSLPAAAAGFNRTIFKGQSTQIGATQVVGSTYSWTSNPSGFTSAVPNPTVSPTVNTTYTLVETSGKSCVATNSVTVTVKDNLTISKSLIQTPTKPGDPFSYQITYSNLNTNGAVANGVVIKDILPAANFFTHVSSSPNYASYDPGTRLMTWNFNNLSPGTYSITVNGKLGSLGNPNWSTYEPNSNYISTGTLPPTTVSNNATIESSTITTPISIPAPVTNQASQFCGFTILPANLTGWIKQSSPAVIYYSLSITNTGNVTDKFSFTKTDVTTDSKNKLDSYFLDNNGNTITGTPWLQPNETYTFLMRFETPNGTNKGINLTDVITTSFVCQTQEPYHIITHIGTDPAKSPDLSITKIASPNPATVGSNITFTITVRNLNSEKAKNPTITDILPANVNFVSASKSPAGVVIPPYNPTTRTVSAYLNTNDYTSSDLPITLTIIVTPTCGAAPSITNSAEVNTSSGDNNPANDIATVTIPVNSNIPAPSVTGSQICTGFTATLNATGANAGYNYKWYNAATGGTLLFTGNPYITPALTANTTYYVSIFQTADPVCESNRTPVTVTVLQTPVINPHPSPSQVCENLGTSFSATVTGTQLTYQWELSVDNGANWSDVIDAAPYSGTLTTTLTISSTAVSMSGYLYRLKARSGSCAWVYSNPALLTVNPIPSCNITGASSVFAGSTYTYTSTPAPADNVTHSWSIIPGTGNATITGSATGSTVTVQATVAGTFTLRDNITRFGCTSFCTMDITVLLACGITPSASVTAGSSQTYTAPMAGMDSYTWTVTGNGHITSGGTTTDQTVTIKAGYSCAPYTIDLTITENGATSTCSQIITVTDNIAPVFLADPPAKSFCVENIHTATYDAPTMDITPSRPDYYTFKAGDIDLDVDSIAYFSDNSTPKGNLKLHWKITDSSNNPITSVSGVVLSDIVGQVSVYTNAPATKTDIIFPGAVGADVNYTITYWLEDLCGNISITKPVVITIKPRPDITKVP